MRYLKLYSSFIVFIYYLIEMSWVILSHHWNTNFLIINKDIQDY